MMNGIFKKEKIVSVDLDLGSPRDFEQHWNIMLHVEGRSTDIDFYFRFEDKGKAIKLQQAILTWVFGEEY